MNLSSYISSVKDDLDSYLQQNIKTEFPKYLYDPILYSLEGGGKKIRPSLLMLVNEYLGGKRNDAVSCAAGIELFHIFSLVHDDIMDHDEMRRGKPTVHKKWDEATAILAGDGLIALSNIFMMTTKHERISDILKVYSEAILFVCEGQAFDKEYELRTDVSLDEYIKMIGLKTACLLGASAKIGAIIASDDETVWEKFYQFGFNLGLAFQVQDDILDLYAEIDDLGKDIGSDIFNNKNSVLTIYARALNSLPVYNSSSSKEQFIIDSRSKLEASGVLEKSVILKDEYTSKALNNLNSFETNHLSPILHELVEKLNSRKA